MHPSEYGIDNDGKRLSALKPLSSIRYVDINTPFAELLNEELRHQRRMRREAVSRGEVFECDELTVEAAGELSLMIAHATANESGNPIRIARRSKKAQERGLCEECKLESTIYRAGCCRPCYAKRLGWSSIKKK